MFHQGLSAKSALIATVNVPWPVAHELDVMQVFQSACCSSVRGVAAIASVCATTGSSSLTGTSPKVALRTAALNRFGFTLAGVIGSAPLDAVPVASTSASAPNAATGMNVRACRR